jgi:hypothetical protein
LAYLCLRVRLLFHDGSDVQRAKWGETGMPEETKGGCLCGSVSYVANGQLRSVVACHCNQCRKTSGHYAAATQVETDRLQIAGKSLTWFRSSQKAERGFCATCGSNLFWRETGSPFISIFAGTIDGPTGLKMERQLYVESAGDYYEVPAIPVVAQSALSR